MKTFYGLNLLNSGDAFFASLLIGFFFGLALERAGFGSSRKISGIFYFTDMAVLKVMFTALLVAMLGLVFCASIGLVDISTQIHFLKTYYGAYAVGGLIFGFGFVMSGWCPGTAMVGLASGKVDALIFLIGAVFGSILFNELFPVIEPLYTWGRSAQTTFNEPGLAFIYKSLGVTQNSFLLLFTAVAVLCFWGVEYVEKVKNPEQGGSYFNSPFLKAFCLLLMITAAGLTLLSPQDLKPRVASGIPVGNPPEGVLSTDRELMEDVSWAQAPMAAEELADRLLKNDSGLTVVDVRPETEYRAFHIRGAVNVPLPELPAFAAENGGSGIIVLYADNMTYPARAREELFRSGFKNVTILTDGLNGFLERCLKPASLRSEPVSVETANRIRAWREYFLSPES
jgi:rhodanese-related sulfurtransferase/uncharacterized membrane protein YedE/YeeE